MSTFAIIVGSGVLAWLLGYAFFSAGWDAGYKFKDRQWSDGLRRVRLVHELARCNITFQVTPTLMATHAQGRRACRSGRRRCSHFPRLLWRGIGIHHLERCRSRRRLAQRPGTLAKEFRIIRGVTLDVP